MNDSVAVTVAQDFGVLWDNIMFLMVQFAFK